MIFSFNRINVAFFLMLALTTQASAITVYDVIQLSNKNYSDKDIIALVEATDSAFALKADDVARLTELGVSEPVIQAMLKAVLPVETAPDTAPVMFVSNPIDNKPDSGTAITYNTPNELVPRADIDLEQLKEPGSGEHHHQVITLSGIRLFILRDEGSYSSLTERAKAVADRLSIASAKDGKFHPDHVAGSDAVMFTATGATQSVMIVAVSALDAHAYQRRSGRRITQDLLAAYWSDLLTDYWSLAFGGRPPDRLAKLHEGEALQELYDGLDKSIKNDVDRMTGAFQSLPKQERDHLLKLAVSVPADFDAADEHTGVTQ
ncbi:MAG: hypothetical protein BMS9Abin25_0017 [Gammaproteobacteria bacterium]|nr:MAG: hypothetical protein BMS9Abin25_0017 [Gammaproteobacteria bacterium]